MPAALSSLATNEGQFRLLAENLPVMCWLADPAGQILWYNRRWYEFTGATPGEMKGWGWQAVHDPATVGEVLERWKASLATGEPFEMVFPLRSASGEYHPFLSRSEPHRDAEGRITHWLGANVDISGQVAAEAALRRANMRLRAMLDALPMLASLQRLDGEAEYINRRNLDYLGVAPAKDLAGRIRLVHPDDQAVFLAGRKRGYAEGEGTAEIRLRRHDGAWRWHSLRWIAFDAEAPAPSILVTGVDIHDLHEAADRIAKSEEQLRLAVEAAEVGLWDVDPVNDTLYWPPRVKAMFGISPDVPVSMADFYAGLHPEDREKTSAAYAAAADPSIRGLYDVEYRTVGKEDGIIRWVAAKGRGIFNDRGACIRVIGTAIDITARKRAAEALAQEKLRADRNAQQLQTIVKSMAEHLYACDREGRPILMNEGYGNLHEGSGPPVFPDSFVNAIEIFDLNRRPVPMSEWPLSRALRGEWVKDSQLRVRGRKSGTERILSVNASPVFDSDGEMAMAVVTSSDITARTQAVAALIENQERLRLSQEAGRVGSWDWDLQTDQLHWSEQQCLQYGVDPTRRDDLRFDQWSSAVHPDDRAAYEAALRGRLADGDDLDIEFRIVTPAGVRWMVGRGHVIRDPLGKAVRMVGIDMDITERRALEDELRSLNERLETRVQEEVAAREAAQTRLAHAQRMEALGQLAGGIAHDFNNILQAAQGAAALIERGPQNPERVKNLAHTIAETVARGATITRRLLAFSRRANLQTEPIDAAILLNGMKEILSHTLGAGVSVKVEVEPGLPALVADRGQLETALVNLATNARDAMAGAGELIMAAAKEVVAPDGPDHRAGLPAGSYIRLAVSDTGCGMSTEVLAKAAEPFFTTKGAGKGTGLGLAMARGFAGQSGGALHIESEVDRGTVVTLWFPVSEEKPSLAEPLREEPAAEARAAVRNRLLMVDDDAIVLSSLAQEMEAEGYPILRAGSGPEALAHLEDGQEVGLVVTDLSMPGMDGLRFIQEVQRRRPGLPAILLTGYATTAVEDAMGGATKGLFSVLHKPIHARSLAERVAVMLEAARGFPRPGDPPSADE